MQIPLQMNLTILRPGGGKVNVGVKFSWATPSVRQSAKLPGSFAAEPQMKSMRCTDAHVNI